MEKAEANWICTIYNFVKVHKQHWRINKLLYSLINPTAQLTSQQKFHLGLMVLLMVLVWNFCAPSRRMQYGSLLPVPSTPMSFFMRFWASITCTRSTPCEWQDVSKQDGHQHDHCGASSRYSQQEERMACTALNSPPRPICAKYCRLT